LDYLDDQTCKEAVETICESYVRAKKGMYKIEYNPFFGDVEYISQVVDEMNPYFRYERGGRLIYNILSLGIPFFFGVGKCMPSEAEYHHEEIKPKGHLPPEYLKVPA
jgi:hypothetical protein